MFDVPACLIKLELVLRICTLIALQPNVLLLTFKVFNNIFQSPSSQCLASLTLYKQQINPGENKTLLMTIPISFIMP